MLFLLPPSETKCAGGSNLNIGQVALTFGALNPARDEVLAALTQLCMDETSAIKALKLGIKQHQEVQTNLAIAVGPVMPAILRYTGTLYDAVNGRGLKGTTTEFKQLDADQLKQARELVLIQSALFGLINATDLIPEYRLSATTSLPSLNLKTIWNQAHQTVWPRISTGMIIDLRSKAYAELAPIPESIEHYSVDVMVEQPDGSRAPLNHFNKKAKGQLVRAALLAKTPPQNLADLVVCAASAGLKLEQTGNKLLLVTSQAT